LTQLIIKQTVWGRLADVLIKITGSKERVQEHGRTIVARQIIKPLVAVAIFSVVGGAAQARDDDEKGKGCNSSTLNGLYVFRASGFNVVSGVAQPKAIIELVNFHGDGTLDVPAATVSINGVIGRSPPGGTGTYTLQHDCTGSLEFHAPGPTYDIFVGLTASDLYMIQTGPSAPVFQGTAERVSH
jgi:hypothetical protein